MQVKFKAKAGRSHCSETVWLWLVRQGCGLRERIFVTLCLRGMKPLQFYTVGIGLQIIRNWHWYPAQLWRYRLRYAYKNGAYSPCGWWFTYSQVCPGKAPLNVNIFIMVECLILPTNIWKQCSPWIAVTGKWSRYVFLYLTSGAVPYVHVYMYMWIFPV